jgi:hypothetical protein
MIYKTFTVMCVLILLSASAHGGSAPKELYGKSITVAWSEARSQRFESEQLVRNTGAAVQMNIYISTAGRPFVRVISSGIAGHSHHEQLGGPPTGLTESAPGEAAAKERVDFAGRSIVVYRQFRSGARRIAIDVDGSTCKATVVNGREGGKSIKQYSNRFGGAEVLSIQVGAISCSIREGNVFGQ